jgi:hypothetical protein
MASLKDATMADCNIERLREEFVELLREQIEALELETYVGLTDAEQRDYVRRQERIRELDATISRASKSAAA